MAKKIDIKQQVEEDEGRTGTGSNLGFVDFLATGVEKRDDLLSADERKRLLGAHRGAHEDRVKRQKELRENRQKLKEGKLSKQDYQQGMMADHSAAPPHPILSDKAQFSGIDPEVNALPNENVADTNNENRNKLENQYRLRHRPENAPKFNPKPLPR